MSDEYDYEYSDGDSDTSSSGDELEDLYENAKTLKSEGNVDEAVAEFTTIVEKDTQKSEQGFRALKQLFKVAKEQNQQHALVLYDQLLAYSATSSLVPRNKIDKTIGNILDRLTVGSEAHFADQILLKTADAFRPPLSQEAAKHERLWFLATKKLAETWLGAEWTGYLVLGQIETWLRELHTRMQDESGADRLDKASRLWEVYALRMRLACSQGDRKQLELLVEKVLQLTCNVNHPETIAFVRECTAYVQFRKSRYTQAYFAFVDAFNHYEQAGSSGRTKCLAYMVLISVLTNTPVAPLTLATTQTLVDDPLIRAASQLLEAYLHGGSSSLLAAHGACEAPLKSDAFVKEVIDVIVLRTLTAKFPPEIWKDILRELTRDDIESSKMVGRRWRAIADQHSEPSRHLTQVSLKRAAFCLSESRMALSLQLAGGKHLRHEGMLTDIAAYFQSLNQEFLQLLSPQFFSDVRVHTVVYDTDPKEKEVAADGELFKKFFLSFRHTPNLTVAKAVTFISDEFLAECTSRGVAKIHLPSTTRALSNDAVFDFCFAPGDRGRTRSFTLELGAFDADFVDRVLQDSKSPATADPVLLRWSVVPRSSEDDQLLAGLRRHASMLVPCDRSAETEKTHEVYRWTTTPQRLHIVVDFLGNTLKTYTIARGAVDLPHFSECSCTRVAAS